MAANSYEFQQKSENDRKGLKLTFKAAVNVWKYMKMAGNC